MKKILSISLYALFITAIFSFNSCKKEEKDEDNVQTVSYNAPAYEVCDVISGANEYSFTYAITVADIQQAFATAGVTYDVSKINTAKLTSIKATVTTGSTFDNVSSIDVYVKVEGASGNGTLVAHLDNIESGISTKSLVVNGAEVKSYLSSDAVLTVKINSKSSANQYICINLTQAVIQAEVQE